jgi:hypothetical protein
MPGDLIDRYGFEGGKTASPLGTSFGARSLPPDYASTKPYNAYRVLKPIEVDKGVVAPWFGEKGLGIQYDLPVSVDVLLRRGFVERYVP